jgi:hypothetical protein
MTSIIPASGNILGLAIVGENRTGMMSSTKARMRCSTGTDTVSPPRISDPPIGHVDDSKNVANRTASRGIAVNVHGMDRAAAYRIEQVCEGGSLWRLLVSVSDRANAWAAIEIGDQTMVEKPVIADFLKRNGFRLYRGRHVRTAR